MKQLFRLTLMVQCLFLSLFASQKIEKVSLQLQWKHQFEFAGFYIAKEKGFYKDMGLDVEIKEFDNGINIVDDVYTGKSTFGVSHPSIVLDKLSGKDVVLLSAILQISPHVLVSLKSSDINSIKDFKNKKIMINHQALNTTSLISMLKSRKITLDDMSKLKVTFDINNLVVGKADIMAAFSSNEPYFLKKNNIEYNVWDPRDYGFEFYDVILFTSKNEIKNSAIKVEDFRDASLRGWKYAFEHIDEAVELIIQKYNTQNKTKEALIYEANILKELAYHNVKEIGKIKKDKIERIYSIYSLLGLVSDKIDLDEFIYTQPSKNNFLTIKEKKYLKEKKSITMCINPNWMPYESFKNGNHIGASADYFKLLSDRLKIDIEVLKTRSWSESLAAAQDRKCDIVSLTTPTTMQKKYLNFTSPYLESPIAIATKVDRPFINSISSLTKNQKIGIPKDYSITKILKEKYKNLNIVEVKNIEYCLQRVKKGEFFGCIGSVINVGYTLQNRFIDELKITGKFNEKLGFNIGVRNDDAILLNILNKSIKNIEPNLHKELLNRWASVKFEKEIDYSLAWKIIIVAFLFILFFMYRQYLLKRSNAILEDRIKGALDENTKQQQILQQQSRLAQMGEMISMIAHQWRQPLSAISSTSSSIMLKATFNKLDNKTAIDLSNRISNYSAHLSSTIDDFRNFFKENKEKSETTYTELVEDVLNIIEISVINKNIKIVKSLNSTDTLYTYSNELKQVILNLIKNAEDILLEHNVENPQISIKSFYKVLIISDNGGGIQEEIIDKIFDPYFSTKFEKNGTGLGLYMSKTIIEKHCGGELTVSNDNVGAVFKINLGINND